MYLTEKNIIKICSKVNCSTEDLKKLNLLMHEHIDWGFLLYQVLHHRITPIVYDCLVRSNSLEYIEKHVRRAMKTECLRIAEKNNILFNEISSINECFLNHGLQAINIKGAIITKRLYPQLSFREFTDIDYYVEKKHIGNLSECLLSLGYVQGHYDFGNNAIRPYSRKEIIEHSIHSHECAEFVKLVKSKYLSSIVVDLNHSIIWNEFYKTTNKIKNDVFIPSIISFDIDGIRGYHLTDEDEFIQLCCHLYSEAVYFCIDPFWLRDKSDINIIKLCDIYLLIQRRKIDWDKIQNKVSKLQLNEPICYALDCMITFFSDFTLPFNVHEFFKYDEPERDLINKYFDNSNKIKYWGCSFEERIFDINKKVNEIKGLYGFGVVKDDK